MAATAWIIVFLVVVNCLVLGEKKREYKLGLLIPYRKVTPHFQNDYNKGESFAAAMTIAVERINADPTLLSDYNLTFVWKDTECNELIAVREQLNQINSGVQAFIGPGCYCQTAAKNAAAFNMTMISFVSMQSFMLCSLISAFLRWMILFCAKFCCFVSHKMYILTVQIRNELQRSSFSNSK